jgi:hypothetical protein
MTTFDPPQTGQAWQLPWLRIELILRNLKKGKGRDEDIAQLLAMRRELEQRGWFN